jgi:hypothetical protein
VLRTAVLATCTRVDGKPRQRYVATLGSIDGVWLVRPAGVDWRYERAAVDARMRFWTRARGQLAGLVRVGTLTSEHWDAFEQQIAQTVPLPTDADLALAADWRRRWWHFARRPTTRALLARMGLGHCSAHCRTDTRATIPAFRGAHIAGAAPHPPHAAETLCHAVATARPLAGHARGKLLCARILARRGASHQSPRTLPAHKG